MNGKKAKKLRHLAELYYNLQPPNLPNRQTVTQIYANLKNIKVTDGHKKKITHAARQIAERVGYDPAAGRIADNSDKA